MLNPFQTVAARLSGAFALVRRLSRLSWISLRFATLAWIVDPLQRRRGRLPPPRPVRLREYFETLGGSFIKLGQMLALQPDIIPPIYCDELFDLMDRVHPFDYETARRIVYEELGVAPEEIFDAFNPEPIATASIGQVYSAVLNGERVAVKIQRPAATAEFLPDTRLGEIMVMLIRALRVQPLNWLIEPTTEFIAWTREELDYRNEARYTSQAGLNARGEAFEKVPKVYNQFTTRRVAVFEFLPGVTVLELIRLRKLHGEIPLRSLPHGYRSFDYCTNVIENFLDGAFNCGLFHADLHPANLMVLAESAVGYIDYGITGVLAEYSRKNLIALTLAYALGDARKMFEIFLRVSTVTPHSDFAGLERGLRQLAHRVAEAAEAGSNTSITAIMLAWLRLSRQTNIWPQRDVIKYIRSAVAVDGLIKRLDPEFSVGPALARAARRHVEAGIRRNVLSYDRLFDAFSEWTVLLGQGAAPFRNALDELAGRDLA